VPTVTSYFAVLPEPFLTKNIYQYRTSFVARQSKRKTYLSDNSFIFLNRIITDKSRLFENIVFNTLVRKHSEIFYYKTTNNKEVDFFIIQDNLKILIQVCYKIDDVDTKKREINSLLKAMEEQKANMAYIYTYNTSEQITFENKIIEIIPFWQYLLNQ